MSSPLSSEYFALVMGLDADASEPPFMPSIGARNAADYDALVRHMLRLATLTDGYVRALAETLYGEPLSHLVHGSQWQHAITDALGDLIADARKCATCPVEEVA